MWEERILSRHLARVQARLVDDFRLLRLVLGNASSLLLELGRTSSRMREQRILLLENAEQSTCALKGSTAFIIPVIVAHY